MATKTEPEINVHPFGGWADADNEASALTDLLAMKQRDGYELAHTVPSAAQPGVTLLVFERQVPKAPGQVW